MPQKASAIMEITLQEINISHLGKRKIIFKMLFLGDMLVPWRVLKTSQAGEVAVQKHPKTPCLDTVEAGGSPATRDSTEAW